MVEYWQWVFLNDVNSPLICLTVFCLYGEDTPKWINNPSDGVYMGVTIVVSKNSGESDYMYEQKIKATINQELSKVIKPKVDAYHEQTIIEDKFGSTIIVSSTSEQTSQNHLKNSYIKDRFVDAAGEWVWGVLDAPSQRESSLVVQAFGKNKIIAIHNLLQSIKGVEASTKTILKNSQLVEDSVKLISSGTVRNYQECESKGELVCYSVKVGDVK